MNQNTIHSSETFVEGIRLISRPLDTDMGFQALYPFVLSVSAETSNYEDLSLTLYSSNSKSIPYTEELNNNWSALKPQWRFVDLDGNRIDEIAAITYHTEVVDENGAVRGGIGTVSFNFIDDLPSECGVPTLLHATVNLNEYYDREYRSGNESITSFYNSKMKTIIPFRIYPIKPEFIHFSQNGVFDLYNTQWAGNDIYGLATIHGIPRNKFLDPTRCAIDYPIIFNSPLSGSDGTTNILNYSVAPLLDSETTPNGPLSGEFLPFEMGSGVANGGWAEVSMISNVTTPSAILSGSVDIDYDLSQYGCLDASTLWVSNKNVNMIHKLDLIPINSEAPELLELYESSSHHICNNVFSEAFNVPYYEEEYYGEAVPENPYELDKYSGIYGMGIDGDGNVWNVDFELDRIYKRNAVGALIFTVDLQSALEGVEVPVPYEDAEYNWFGPSSISLDRMGNAYVTIVNSASVVKILSNGTLDGYFTHPNAPEEPPPANEGNNENEYYRPIDVETDPSGRVHVLYSNTDRSSLVMFDLSGNSLCNPWDVGEVFRPYDMAYHNVGGVASLFITMKGDDSIESGVKRIGINPTANSYVLDEFDEPFESCDAYNPSYITVDLDKNIWFAYDDNKIGVLTEWSEDKSSSFYHFDIPVVASNPNDLANNHIGGICCDSNNFLNVIQTYTNIIYRVDIARFIVTAEADRLATPYAEDYTGGDPTLHGIKITPDENFTIIELNGEIERVDALPGEEVRSLQAFGDWSGLGWEQKFGTFSTSLDSNVTRSTLIGSSSVFEIDSLNAGRHELRRFNDSWDMTKQIKSYVIPDFQKEFTDLWDDLIGNIVGNDDSGYQTFGRQMYEKIANFVLNHSDIDLSNISQTYSMFTSLGLNYIDYNFKYPAELGHWMNIASIMFERLKGTQYQCNRNFKPKRFERLEPCEVCGQVHDTNMGDLIENPEMVIGEGVVIRDTYKTVDAFDVFYPPLSGSFEQLTEYGFRSPFSTNYEVFELIPTVGLNKQAAGLINWVDTHNDLDISTIDAFDWWKSGGYVEKIITEVMFDELSISFDVAVSGESAVTRYFGGDGDYDGSHVPMVTDAVVVSQFFMPMKASLCSPIGKFAIPCYLASSTIDVDTELLPIDTTYVITDGVMESSTQYARILIDKAYHYIPAYEMDAIVMPVFGLGIAFEEGLVSPPTPLTSLGFLPFKSNMGTILIPVLKE